MILSNLKYSHRVESLHPLFKSLFDYIKQNDLLGLECGKIVLDGDNLFINNINPDCKAKEEQILETHRDYIDVHVLLQGEETIGWKPLEKAENQIQEYKKETDCALYSDLADNYFTIRPGDFVIIYPEDAHAPMIGKGKIRKLIAKVKI